MGTNVVEALCIEQVLGEGYAIGSDLYLVDLFRQNGHIDLSEIHRSIHDDEFMHAKKGYEWFTQLAGSECDQVIATLEPKFAVPPPADQWFREDLRTAIGFSTIQIARQRALAKPLAFKH
jgi:hypothetical protein